MTWVGNWLLKRGYSRKRKVADMSITANLQHLQPHERQALFHLVTRLRQRFSEAIRHVWLFGSKARGDSDLESDIDLLIVVDDYNWPLEKDITRLTTQTDYTYGVVLSDHVISVARFEQMATRREPFYYSLEREGIDLWTLEPQPIT